MKPRLLIIAGWAHGADACAPLASLLSSRFDVQTTSTADLYRAAKGHGGTEASPSPYARALEQMVSGKDVPCHVAGWSMGAVVALEAAALGLIRPERLIVISGTARFCAAADYAAGLPDSRVRALGAALGKKPRETLSGFFSDTAFPSVLPAEALARKSDQALGQGLPALLHGLDYLRQTDLRERLAALALPVFAFHGRNDRVIPWQASDWLCRRLPDARLSLLDDAGHALPAQKAPIIAQSLIQ